MLQPTQAWERVVGGGEKGNVIFELEMGNLLTVGSCVDVSFDVSFNKCYGIACRWSW